MKKDFKENIKKSKERIKSGIILTVRDILIKYLKTDFLCSSDKNIIQSWYNDDSFYINKDIIPKDMEFNELLFILFNFYIKQKKYRSDEIDNLIIEKTSSINDSLQGKIYNIITKNIPPLCKNGNKLRFSNYETGFNKTCSKTCQCIKEKRKQTNIKKYGVDNPAKLKEFKEKSAITSLKKYGTDNPSKSKEIIEKIKQTNQERYGVNSNLELKEIKDKIKQTNIKKYGVDHNFKSKEVRNKIKNTFIEKYGVDNPFKSNEIKEKIKEINIERYGVDNPLKSKEIKDKIKQTNIEKYGIHDGIILCNSQKNYSDKTKRIIFNKDILEYELKNKTPIILGKELSIHPATIYRYIKKYNINYFYKRSSYEIDIENWLISQNINFQSNTKNIISPMELDFYLPEYNLAIEFNGLYWHSDIFKENNYHLNKYLSCKEKGIRLIMIQEDEWFENSNLIKSKILNILGKSEKGLPARKLTITNINNSIANNFCETYHIQGKTGQIIYSCGAFDDEELVGVMIFNKQRNTGDIELIRFCTDGKIHNGLFSKMLKFSIKENKFEKIISFADLRYSEGNLYEKTGFTKLYQIKPDYVYIHENKTFHKSNYSKASIKKKNFFDEEYINSHTEKELTEELELYRIYDIGKIKYEMNINGEIL